MRKLIIAVATLGFIGPAHAQISNDAWMRGYVSPPPPITGPPGSLDHWLSQPQPHLQSQELWREMMRPPPPSPPIHQDYGLYHRRHDLYVLPTVPYGGSPRVLITPDGTGTCFGTGALQTCF